IAARVAPVDLPAAGAELLDRDRTEARDAVAHSPHPALEPSERQDVELGRRSPGSQSRAGRARHVVPGAHHELLATWSQWQLPVQARLAALEQVVPATRDEGGHADLLRDGPRRTQAVEGAVVGQVAAARSVGERLD